MSSSASETTSNGNKNTNADIDLSNLDTEAILGGIGALSSEKSSRCGTQAPEELSNSNDDAQNIMEQMFSSLMQNPELSAALLQGSGTDKMEGMDLMNSLNMGSGEDASDQLGALLSSLTSGSASEHGTGDSHVGDDQRDETATTVPSPVSCGMEDITASLTADTMRGIEISPTTLASLDLGDAVGPVADYVVNTSRDADGSTATVPLDVKFESDDVKALYDIDNQQYSSDSGWDLRFTEDVTIPPGGTHKFDFGVSVCGYTKQMQPSALWLLPRSSIVKTPLRLANSMGLIDSSYRGTLRAYVDNIKTEPFSVKRGERLFQIASPSLAPFRIRAVDELSTTERGEKGFGSTGA